MTFFLILIQFLDIFQKIVVSNILFVVICQSNIAFFQSNITNSSLNCTPSPNLLIGSFSVLNTFEKLDSFPNLIKEHDRMINILLMMING